MEAIMFCAQQGIALLGHRESDEDDSNPGNFRCLIQLLSRHSTVVAKRLSENSSSASWLSPTIQNEIIHFLANQVRMMIKEELQTAKYFTILADEAKDGSKREQISIAFRYVFNNKTVE
jgi:hypothetical protein